MIILIDYLCAHLFDLFIDSFGFCSLFNEVLGFFFFLKNYYFLANNPNKFYLFITFSENYFFPKFTNEFANQLGEEVGFVAHFEE